MRLVKTVTQPFLAGFLRSGEFEFVWTADGCIIFRSLNDGGGVGFHVFRLIGERKNFLRRLVDRWRNQMRIKWSRLGHFFLIMGIGLSFLIPLPDPVWACSCVAPGSPLEERSGSAAVFAGRVQKVTPPLIPFIGNSGGAVEVEIKVFEVWKGPLDPKIVVETSRSGASCGFPFEKGEEYFVYAQEREGKFSVSLCSRTRHFSAAEEDLRLLGEGIQVGDSNPAGGGQIQSSLVLLLVAGLSTLGFIAVYRIRNLLRK